MHSNDQNGLLLSDSQMQQFIRDGYVTVHTALPEEFHAAICRQADTLLGAEPNPGNNLLPRLPDLARMLGDPAVHGALTSILGPGYLLDDHRYCHDNRPGSKPQRMHQDGGSQGDHRTRKVLLLYYPQDTLDELGPTGVLPGSQYYAQRPPHTAVRKVTGSAGTVTITHYELWHGATANRTQRPRYMMKFLLHRMQEPEAPSWNAGGPHWETESTLWHSMWNWHCGETDAEPTRAVAGGDGDADLDGLADAHVQRGMEAAYALASAANGAGSALAGRLCAALAGDCAVTAARAVYALAALGPAVVPPLSEAVAHPEAGVRARAAQALAEMGGATSAAEPALRRALSDDDSRVRSWAASALGTGCGVDAEASIVALAATIDADMPDRGYRRQTAAHAMARLAGKVEADAADRVVHLLAPHLESGNRYVRGLTAVALRRLDAPAATEMLLDWLTVARWCPITAPDSPYIDRAAQCTAANVTWSRLRLSSSASSTDTSTGLPSRLASRQRSGTRMNGLPRTASAAGWTVPSNGCARASRCCARTRSPRRRFGWRTAPCSTRCAGRPGGRQGRRHLPLATVSVGIPAHDHGVRDPGTTRVSQGAGPDLVSHWWRQDRSLPWPHRVSHRMAPPEASLFGSRDRRLHALHVATAYPAAVRTRGACGVRVGTDSKGECSTLRRGSDRHRHLGRPRDQPQHIRSGSGTGGRDQGWKTGRALQAAPGALSMVRYVLQRSLRVSLGRSAPARSSVSATTRVRRNW